MRSRHRSGVAGVAGFALLAAAPVFGQIAGCSSGASEPSSRSEVNSAGAVPAGASEHVRAQAFVEARYAATDVQHSFRTRFGETIDCIDFFAQPGVKALAARGTPITELPKPATKLQLTADSPLALAAFDGSLDDDGNARACSDTTVPQLRLTVEDIERSGGLDRYLAGLTKTPAHLLSQGASETPPDGAGPAYAHAQVDYTGGASFPTDRATLSVWAPSLTANPGVNHSLEQTWTTSTGQQWSAAAPCAPNCQQTVEVGWTVDANLNSGNNPASPHLFIYSTGDGYQTGCYNGSLPANLSNSTHCPAWVAKPGAVFTPGMTLTASTATTPPSMQELTVQVTACSVYGDCPGGWELQVRTLNNGTTPLSEVGYYPSSDYTGTFTSVATVFQAGAEVDDTTDLNTTTSVDGWKVAMGNGAPASLGYGKAGYVHDYAVYSSASISEGFDFPYSTIPSYGAWTYAPSTTSLETEAGWSNFFYVGAPSQLPAVTSISPASGPTGGGTVVTVHGVNFSTSGTKISFGNVPASSVSCSSSTTCTATSPSLSESGASYTTDVIVTVNETVSATGPQDQFTYSGTGPVCSGYWSCTGTTPDSVFQCNAPPTGASFQLRRLVGSTYENVATTINTSGGVNPNPTAPVYVSEVGFVPPTSQTSTDYEVCYTANNQLTCSSPIALTGMPSSCACVAYTCAGQCGNAPNGCGGILSCGGCPTGEVCSDFACVRPTCNTPACKCAAAGGEWDGKTCE